MTKIHSRFVEVDGINTHYLEAGPADAPTVALLHSGEFGGCAEIMQIPAGEGPGELHRDDADGIVHEVVLC